MRSKGNDIPDPALVSQIWGKSDHSIESLKKVIPSVCAGLSGVAALMYEVLWNRSFLTLTGSTTLSAAAVLAAFMGGLAAGSLIMGKGIRHLRHPKAIYAVVEVSIALYALLLQVLIPKTEATLYAAVWPHLNGNPFVQDLFHLGLGLLFLGPGAFLMGSTFPLLLALTDLSAIATKAAVVYSANAFGGTTGALLAGFGTFPYGGASLTLIVAASLNLSSALLAFFGSPRTAEGPHVEVPEKKPLLNALDSPDVVCRLVYILLVLSGMTALGLEIVWTRLLVLLTGSSTYAFSLLTASAVLGIGLGSRSASRRADRLRSPRLVMSHLELGILVACLVALGLFQKLPSLLLQGLGIFGFSYAHTLIVNGITAFLLLLPSFYLFGLLFPVAVQIFHKEGRIDDPAPSVYASLGFGNMLGAWTTPALLIPRFGLQGTVEVLGFISLGIGLILALGLRAFPGLRIGTLLAGTAVSLLLFLLPPWHPLLMTAGIYRQAPMYWNLLQEGVSFKRILGSYRLLYYKEGLQTTVSVVERPGLKETPYRFLAVDGKVDASTGADMNTEILSGHIPLLLHPNPRKVLVIGLASGVTAGSVEQHASVHRLTVAEIEPAIVEAARLFRGANHRALSDPRLHLVLDDGRHFLSTTRDSFDVIISEPSNPWLSGPSRLFTLEFFRKVEFHLASKGIFAQWLPLYGLSPSLLKAEVRTFLDVFPHAILFQVAKGDLLLVGSPSSLHRWSRTRLTYLIVTDMARLRLDPEDAWGMFVAGTQGLRTWVGQGPLNTDRNGLLEFGAPRYLLVDTLSRNQRVLAQIPWKDDLARWAKGKIGTSSPTVAYDLSLIALRHHEFGRADFLATLLPPSLRHEVAGRIASDQGFFRIAQQEWSLSGTPASIRLQARQAVEEGQGSSALQILRRLVPETITPEDRYLQGLAFLEAGHVRKALDIFDREVPNLSDSRHVLLPYLVAILDKREGDRHGYRDSLRSFRHLLDGLRQKRERDRGNRRMNDLLRTIRQWSEGVLSEKESRLLKRIVQARLVDPLGLYYQGVALLWMGQSAQGKKVLRDYLDSLPPEERPTSRATNFLSEDRSPSPSHLHSSESGKRTNFLGRGDDAAFLPTFQRIGTDSIGVAAFLSVDNDPDDPLRIFASFVTKPFSKGED